jgi:hypothetical protein
VVVVGGGGVGEEEGGATYRLHIPRNVACRGAGHEGTNRETERETEVDERVCGAGGEGGPVNSISPAESHAGEETCTHTSRSATCLGV